MTYKFSIHSDNPVQLGDYFGYSVAYYGIKNAIENMKINNKPVKVYENSPEAKIQLHMGAIQRSEFHPGQYQIHMQQWESTIGPKEFLTKSKRIQEFWTANNWGAQAIVNAGVPERKVYVMEHGIDSSAWTPAKRGNKNKIRFLHIDSDNPRKRSDLVLKAFKSAFGDNPDYELTLKYGLINNRYVNTHPITNLDWSRPDVLEHGGEWSKNVRLIKNLMTQEDLVSLFHFHDVLVFPSEGEGFGLIPLQALATGMPVISTGRWPSYEKYLNDNIIESTLGPSTYLRYFRGDCVIPDLDSTIYLLKQVAENISEQSELFYNQVPKIQTEYSWKNKTEPVILELYKRVPNKFI